MIRSNAFCLSLATATMLAACAPNTSSSSSAQNGTNGAPATAPKKVVTEAELNAIQYPVAIVIEGGVALDSNAFFGKRDPAWRLYLCLDKSETVQQKSVVIDVGALSGGLEQRTTYDKNGRDVTHVVTSIAKMKVSVEYKASLEISQAANLYAWGTTDATVSLTPVEKVLISSDGPLKENPNSLVEVDSETYGKGSLVSVSTKFYGVDNPHKYVSRTLERVGYSSEDGALRTTACEGQSKSTILLTGSALANDIAAARATDFKN